MKKLDKILFLVWIFFIPMILAIGFLYLILLEYGAIDIEMPFDGAVWLNSSCVLIIAYIFGWFINLTIGSIKDIVLLIKKNKEKKDDVKHN